MKSIYMTVLVLATVTRVATAFPAASSEPVGQRPRAIIRGEDTPPASSSSLNAEDELKQQKRIEKNQRRAEIVNQFLRKRGSASTVVASVSALNIYTPIEATIGMISRGLRAGLRKLPFGGGSYYSGLHPHYIEFKNKDEAKASDLAACVLDFYTSRLAPDRIFLRTRSCSETDLAHWADKRGFTFAGMVQLKNGRVEKFRDLTETDLLISDLRLRRMFEDPEAFEPKGGAAPQEPEVNAGES